MGDTITTRWWKVLGLGFLIWLLPYFEAKALFFMEISNEALFRSTIILTGALIAGIAIAIYLPGTYSDYRVEGWVTALIWVVMCLGLDVLVGFTIEHSTFELVPYLLKTGWSYLYLPIVCVPAGYLARNVEQVNQPPPVKPPEFRIR